MNIIALFLPSLLAALEGVSVFCVLLKKIRGISFKKETNELSLDVKKMIKENEMLRADNKTLRKQLSLIIDKNMKISNYEENKANEESQE